MDKISKYGQESQIRRTSTIIWKIFWGGPGPPGPPGGYGTVVVLRGFVKFFFIIVFNALASVLLNQSKQRCWNSYLHLHNYDGGYWMKNEPPIKKKGAKKHCSLLLSQSKQKSGSNTMIHTPVP